MKTFQSFFFFWIIIFLPHTIKSQCSVSINASAGILCVGDSATLSATGNGTGGQVLDQSQTVYNAGTSARNLPGYSEWQSFTAGLSGTMTEIDIGFFNAINGVGTLNIYKGAGDSGTLLQTQSVNVICAGGNCLLPFTVSVPVIADSQYTFQFIPGAGIPDPYGVQVEVPGTYAGGQMALIDPSGTSYPGFDMVFNTYVSGALFYQWSTGSTASSITVSSAGNYAVTVSDSSGCEASDTIFIRGDSTAINETIINTSCGNQNGSISVHLSGSVAPFVFNWSNGSFSDSITNLSAGSYRLTVTDSAGCSVSALVLIDSSVAPVCAITPGNQIICSYDTAQFCATAGFVNYLWSSGQQTSCIKLNIQGTYSVIATDSNGCTAQSDSVSLTAYSPSLASITQNGDTLVAHTGVNYQWYKNGQPLGGDTSFFIIVAGAGMYTVIVTDSNGCTAVSDTISVTGILNASVSGVGVYPNPWHEGNLILEVNESSLGGIVELADNTGRVVYKAEVLQQKSYLPNNMPAGIFLLYIRTSTNTVVRKVIKI
jgi:hypothetical protein